MPWSKVQSCTMIRTNNEYKGITKLELRLIHENKSDVIVELYNENRDTELIHELELIKKWCDIINKNI